MYGSRVEPLLLHARARVCVCVYVYVCVRCSLSHTKRAVLPTIDDGRISPDVLA